MNRSYIIAMIKSQSTNYILIEFTSVNEMYKSPKKMQKYVNALLGLLIIVK